MLNQFIKSNFRCQKADFDHTDGARFAAIEVARGV